MSPATRPRNQKCSYCGNHPRTSFDYVHHRYGVPARRAMRVTADGSPGVITSGAGKYIRVRLDGAKHSFPWHPTWNMVYHTEHGDRTF